MFLFSLTSISAVNPYFDFDVECFQGCGEGIANPDSDIILKVTIKNNFDYWIKLGYDNSDSINLAISVDNKNVNNGRTTEDHRILGSQTYIPPKTQIEVYIPFDTYNDMDRDKRISDWILTPSLSTQQVRYYEDPFNSDKTVNNIREEYKIPGNIVDNQLKFEGKLGNVEIETNPFSKIINKIKGFFNNWIGYIIAGIIIGVGIWFLTKRK